MAKDNETNQQPRMGAMKRIAQLIQGNTDDLYKNTYYSDPDNKQQLQALKTDITNTIKDIMNTNTDNIGEPNISRLYERMFQQTQNDAGTVREFERIFGDNEYITNLTNSYLDNRWIRSIDIEIDEVCKYMPKLQEALDTIRDNVLSADSFSKDYLTLNSQLTGSSVISDEQFSRNIEDLKKNYKLLKFIKDTYDNTSKYGEEFIYCVPYDKAIQKLLNKKSENRGVIIKTNFKESSSFVIQESGSGDSTVLSYSNKEDTKDININIQIEEGIISSLIQGEYDARTKRTQANQQSITEQYFNEVDITELDMGNGKRAYAYNKITDNDLELNGRLPVHHRFDNTLSDNLDLPKGIDGSDKLYNTASDGLIDKDKNPGGKIKSMNGCVLKRLKRHQVVPIILNDICLGYYYFEFDNAELFDERMVNTNGMINTIAGIRSSGRSEAFDALNRREELLRNIAACLAQKIDNKFVDNNQELKKEIYYILKYNDDYNSAAGSLNNNIRVSYLPPEDVHHIYFDLDEDTHRGISDLSLSLIPAKLWVAIYITNCLAIMTRGNDKRVYYVRQSVDSNISKTLLKTINEIKKANFGIRQVENINSVLNITGRFNDYIIPRGADGQSPIEFEVMQGQQIEIKTELLNLLEESAINVTGIPIEIIQNRQSPDYAMQLTMSNSKFLRFVYDRQSEYQEAIENLISKLYNIEYGTRDKITVELPPPLFINVTNTNQLIVNTNDYCDNIVNIVMADEQDEILKAKFAKELKIYHLGSYLNMATVQKLYEKAKQENAKKKAEDEAEGAGGEDQGY